MPLTQIEKEGIQKILKNLQLDDIFSLTFTITKGLVKPETRNESLEAILLYCETPSLLLRRRKVKKEFIFGYLMSEGINVPVNSDKSDFVKACLKHWNSGESQTALDCTNYEMDEMDEEVKIHVFQSHTTSYQVAGIPEFEEILLLGQSLAQWFYNLVNKISGIEGLSEPFKSEDLWPDCVLKWQIQDRNSSKSGAIQMSNNVANFLTLIVSLNALRFDPSIPTITSRYEGFGTVQVFVEGVVHQTNNCVGLFKQLFGLVKSPQDNNNWKIKFTEIQLQVNCTLTSGM